MTRTLIYIHATNGSGKSTLARRVGLAAGGFGEVEALRKNPKARWTITPSGVVFLGKYGNACGGVDGIQPYAAVHSIVSKVPDSSVFAEGLVTPGVETCENLARMFDKAVFIALDVPLRQCVANVIRRRYRAGNLTPYDPSNLLKKAKTVVSWQARLQAAGLDARSMTYKDAYELSLELLGLDKPSVSSMLE